MKRKFIITAFLAICFSLLASSTLAYFSDESKAKNVITSGEISIDLLEWADKENNIPYPSGSALAVMPGTVVDKLVEVKNKGANAAFIRVKVDKSIVLVENLESQVDLNLVKIDFDQENWTLGEDGYYYFNRILENSDVTEALFTKVTFDKDMNNKYQQSTAHVNVTAHAVQADNNGSSALEAKGWPE